VWDIEKNRRLRILALLLVAVVGLLIARLAWLQLFQGAQYKKIADDNRLRRLYIQAPRGTIYDRNGAVLASNRPSFAISVVPAEYTDPRTVTAFLASLAGLPPGEVETIIAAGKDNPYTPVQVIRDAGPAVLTAVEERKATLPGVIVEAIPVRHYVYGSLAAHVLGHVAASAPKSTLPAKTPATARETSSARTVSNSYGKKSSAAPPAAAKSKSTPGARSSASPAKKPPSPAADWC
jgi:penicillin-binding protein 2